MIVEIHEKRIRDAGHADWGVSLRMELTDRGDVHVKKLLRAGTADERVFAQCAFSAEEWALLTDWGMNQHHDRTFALSEGKIIEV